MRVGVVAIAVLCLAVPVAGQTGWYDQGGVEYYMAVGGIDSGHLSKGHDYDADDPVPFYGCLVAKVRPDRELGRVRVVSQIAHTPVEISFLEFTANRQDMQGGIATNLPVDGSRTHPGPNGTGLIQHPAVPADVAAWGEAVIDLEGFVYNDPTNDNVAYAATFFVTPTGFRDDETGQVLNHDGTIYEPGRRAIRNDGEYEMHLRLESLPGTRASGDTQSVQQPPQMIGPGFPVRPPQDFIAPTPGYREVYTFLNTRFGGEGTLDVRASAMEVLGTGNDVDFIMRAPDGQVVSEFAMTPAAGGEDSNTGTFDLDRFGYYTLEVAGNVNYFEYSFDFTQSPPETFDLHFWWDNVTLGSHAPYAQRDCFDALQGTSLESQGSIPLRDEPPRWPVAAVVVTCLAVFSAAMTMVMIAIMRRADLVRKRLGG